MSGLPRILIAAAAVVILCLGFGWGFCRWWGLDDGKVRDILMIYGGAAVLALGLFLAGQFLSLRSLGYFVTMGGIVFLAVDVVVWARFGIMPGNKMLRNGFIPAGLMGVFAGALYARIALAPASAPRDFRH